MKTLLLAQDVATLAQQTLVMFDDLDDKVSGNQRVPQIDRDDVKAALALLRKAMDQASMQKMKPLKRPSAAR